MLEAALSAFVLGSSFAPSAALLADFTQLLGGARQGGLGLEVLALEGGLLPLELADATLGLFQL